MGLKIAYVAKHDSGGNDDEGAVTHALLQLGHDVQRVREERGDRAWRMSNCAFLLCHHWRDFDSLRAVKIPKVAWCFDLIDFPDPTLARRCRDRSMWARDITKVCDLAFFTDGEWVAKDTTGKARWLTQGADERVTGPGETGKCDRCGGPWQGVDLLFTGTARGGQLRESFVAEMRERYGDRFLHVASGLHGRQLANLIAGAKIVVAPDGPIAPRYASNRAYNALGFGACLVHPYCDVLDQQYHKGGLCFYRSRSELHATIERLLSQKAERQEIATRGYQQTIARNLYRHRCEELCRIVREKLL